MAGTGVDLGAGVASGGDVLLRLCGEVLLRPPPTRQPTIVRAGATVGLELLDLLLNPDHVLRATEELILRNAQRVGRRVRLDVSLDQLSRRQEEGAMQLSALVSRRVRLQSPVESEGDGAEGADQLLPDAVASGSERLWIPLDTVPRPVPASITVCERDGTVLPRPPQRDVNRALEAALYQVLRELLRSHADFDPDGVRDTPVTALMRRDNPSRWLLQAALVSLCRTGQGTPRDKERIDTVTEAIAHAPSSDPSGRLPDLLQHMIERERGAGRSSHCTTLGVLRDAVSHDGPFLELLRLVHGHYFVVAGLERAIRYHSVEFELPESEALGSSVIKKLYRRTRRTIDPREHNYTIRVRVPIPDNVRQYNLLVRAGSLGARSNNEVSLIGAIRYDGHPGRRALDSLRTCARELYARRAAPPDGSQRVQREAVRFTASQAVAALDHLRFIVDHQNHAAEELQARWSPSSTWTVKRSAETLRSVTDSGYRRLETARREIERLLSYDDGEPSFSCQVGRTADALDAVVEVMAHELLTVQLITNDLPGQEVARIRVDRSMLASTPAPRPRTLEVWGTITDEARPFAYSAIGPPLSLAVLIYFTGALLFDALAWPAHGFGAAEIVSTAQADAVAAVLLLAPALAATQFAVPDRWSVSGWLRRTSRLFVLAAIAALGGTAMVVATQVGSSDAGPEHPGLLFGTFLAAVGLFAGWSVWAGIAAGLRKRYAWRPKGLESLFGEGTFIKRRRRWYPARRLSFRVVRFLSYGRKAPEAEFDLTLPSRPLRSEEVDV